MATYLVVHHRKDPNQPWPNAWIDDDRIDAIQTTGPVAVLCKAIRERNERLLVHRCRFDQNPPMICCSASVSSVDELEPGTWLVRFDAQKKLALVPPVQVAHGQNSYVA